MAVVVGVSGGTQVRGVSVCTVAIVSPVLGVVGWGEAASFDNRGHVNRRRRVGSQDDAVFFKVARHVRRDPLGAGGQGQGQPEVTRMS